MTFLFACFICILFIIFTLTPDFLASWLNAMRISEHLIISVFLKKPALCVSEHTKQHVPS